MGNRSRNPMHFPQMKVRGKARRKRRGCVTLWDSNWKMLGQWSLTQWKHAMGDT